MTNEDLQGQLQQLHRELEQAKNVAAEDRDMLSHLMSDMVEIAQGKEPEDKPLHHLLDQLEERASEFEVDHPRLATTIRQVLDALNRMGI
ncbi:MAG: DUF4404 family protein [Porticoccaceae bacterium]